MQSYSTSVRTRIVDVVKAEGIIGESESISRGYRQASVFIKIPVEAEYFIYWVTRLIVSWDFASTWKLSRSVFLRFI